MPRLRRVLPPGFVPVTIRQFLVVPIPGNQALDRFSQHAEIVPVAKLIELTRTAERFHLWQSYELLSALTPQAAQGQREQNVFRVQATLVVTANRLEIFATAKR